MGSYPEKKRGDTLLKGGARIGGGTNYTDVDSSGAITQAGTACANMGVVHAASLRGGGATNKTEIGAAGNIAQGGTACANLGVVYAASFRGGGVSNKTEVSAIGNISQGGAASAALGDVSTACLKVGSAGTDIGGIIFGTFSPCFNVIAACTADSGSGAITGLTTSHKLFVTPRDQSTGCLVLLSACAYAGSAKLFVLNAGSAAMTASATCPWAYLAFV